MSSKTVSFEAYKTATKPVRVKFKTKSGKTVSFKAIQTFRKRETVRFSKKRK